MLEQIWSLQLANKIAKLQKEFQEEPPLVVLVQSAQRMRSLSLRVEHKLRHLLEPQEPQKFPELQNSEPALVQCYTKGTLRKKQNGLVSKLAFMHVEAQEDLGTCLDLSLPALRNKARFLWLPNQVLNTEKMIQLECSTRFIRQSVGPFSILYHSALTAENLQILCRQSEPKIKKQLDPNLEMPYLERTWRHLNEIFFRLRSVLGPHALSYFLKGWYRSELTGKGLHWHPHFASLRTWDFSDLHEVCLWLYEHL